MYRNFPCNGHWMDFTFFESPVVRTRIKIIFQITAIMKLLSNHGLDQTLVNVFRSKITN